MKKKGKLLLCMLQIQASAISAVWTWLSFNDVRRACGGSGLLGALLRDSVFISCLALALVLGLVARFSLRGLTAALEAEGKKLRDKPERRIVLASLTLVLSFILIFLLLGVRKSFHPMLLLALFAAADLCAAALVFQRLVRGESESS